MIADNDKRPVPRGSVPVSAIVAAYRRIEQTLETLRRIEACEPRPDEVLVHVDGGETACTDAVRALFPHLTVIESEMPVGPGGGRNKLVRAARNELISSFDDDSYPIDRGFFARAVAIAEAFPAAALIGANIVHIGEAIPEDARLAGVTASFVSCGVVLRRSAFLAAGGFVPLVVAYGMEEEDLALRLFDCGQELIHSPWLRVFHNTDRSHHASARITAGTISNLALLAWLRYPVRYWPYGALQVANRISWCLRVGRRAGVLSGLAAIPALIGEHWVSRRPVTVETMRAWAAARKGRIKTIRDFGELPLPVNRTGS